MFKSSIPKTTHVEEINLWIECLFQLTINAIMERKGGNTSAKGWEMGGLISCAKLTLGAEIKFNLLAKIWLSSYSNTFLISSTCWMCLKLDLAHRGKTPLLISCSVGHYQEHFMHPGLFLFLIQAYH